LRIYLNESLALREIPGLCMLGMPLSELRQRAESLAMKLRAVAGVAKVTVSEDVAYVGGGSLPDQSMPTFVLEIQASQLGDADFAHRLRTGEPAVVGRLREGELVLDLRTVFPHQETALVEAIAKALRL
jgi:L-seryl-tRNA(Ser) seleniumtransferase